MRGVGVGAVRWERGQATPEYVGLVLLLAGFVALAVALSGPGLAATGLARALVGELICGFGLTGCDAGSEAGLSATEAAYGREVAALLARHTPDIFFEDDEFVSLPVDFRDCRHRSCADTVRAGAVHSTQTGLPATAFTHVIDCRRDPPPEFDCTGERAGNLYLQFWLYYPDSLTHGLGRVGGYHRDDWESVQIRIDNEGNSMARASSHHGYNGRSGGFASIGSDMGWSPRAAWDTNSNALHVAAGSHAGTTGAAYGDSRVIRSGRLRLVPAEPIASDRRSVRIDFEVTPPWFKEVWGDPESMGT